MSHINNGNIIPERISIDLDDTLVAASGVLTSDNTEVVDGDTVTINGVVYRFKDTMAAINDVQRSGTVDTTLANLRAAINGTGTPGTEYFAGTVAQTLVTCSAVAAHAVTITAVTGGTAGNSIAIAESSIHLSWDSGKTALSGGGGTVGNYTLVSEGGMLHNLISVAPQWTGTPTYSITIKSAEGDQLFTVASLAENSSVKTVLELMLAPGDIITITASGTVESTGKPLVLYLR